MEFDNIEIALAKLAGGPQAQSSRAHPHSYRSYLRAQAGAKPSFGEWTALKVEVLLRAVGLVARTLKALALAAIAAPRAAVAGAREWWSGARPWR